MKGSPFRKKKRAKEDIDLNITAMASVFTVILVFLLKSFSVDPTPLQATADIRLPQLAETAQVREAFKLEVSRDSILFDDRKLLELSDFKVVGEGTGQSQFQELSARIQQQVRLKTEGGEKAQVALFADEEAPQSLVEEVMSSAAQAGLTEIQLVVVKDDS
jgi:biopolymer transport protein ExbD